MAELYDPTEWFGGLRCIDCHTPFVEGQPISERLTDMTVLVGDDEIAAHTEVVCVGCAAQTALLEATDG